MSIKDRLAKKTGDLVSAANGAPKLEETSQTSSEEVNSEVRQQPRTGPGQMLAYRSHMQENNQRVVELQNQLKEFEGSIPAKLLDPKFVRASKWANRHDSSFSNAKFEELKLEIEASKGNVQPIRVRPTVNDPGYFEIVFGHRRHQACLQLGIQVLAMIETASDKELFVAMDRENRAREDLSPYEQGEMYRRALDDGLYPSLRKLAEDVGIDPGHASKAIAIARLPSQVLAAFENPSQIQYRWGQELVAAMQKDPEGVIARAKTIRFSAKQLPPSEALDRLLGRTKTDKPEVTEIKQKGRIVGKIIRKIDGSIIFELKAGVLEDDSFAKIRALLDDLICS